MAWNWEQPDWPNFTWQPDALSTLEQRFLVAAGEFSGAARHLQATDREQLTVEAFGTEALATSQIEGEILDRASVQSSIRRQLGLAVDRRRIAPAEEGIAEVMVDVYREFDQPLHHDTLFQWHRKLLQGRTEIRDLGRYRTLEEPMQIVSQGRGGEAMRVHFEAPPSSRVPEEMSRFIDCFNGSAPGGSKPLPALARAGVAHLYFESIHPFEDGNGRIGRAISEKAIAQALGQVTFTSMAPVILSRRKAYYEVLGRASLTMEITEWLTWFAEAAIEGQLRTMGLVEFLLAKTRLLDRLRGQMNIRQEKALIRMFAEGPAGFAGGLSAANYIKITGTSTATATRDLSDLVAKGALTRTGELRHARYHLALAVRV